ncbi:MAG: 50S ribosomal protein L29 [Acidimicrobiia bacterium]|nr:50S ribosomal protein L29 [Acidimicrobiia bacterium]
MSKGQELRDLNDEVLVQRLAQAKEELFNLRFAHATGQLDNTTRLGDLRRDVARINTVVREREIAIAESMATEE